MRKIEALENINKELDSEVSLLTQLLNKSSLELERNRIKLETLRNDLNSNIKMGRGKIEENEDIKTRWSLKESKPKNKDPLWEGQHNIPQVLSNKHRFEINNLDYET